MATATESMPEIKTLLNSLTKLSSSEFDAQFREWMNRDDVSRGLQAKLRSDLIANFNKTTLGKQLLSHPGHVSTSFHLCLTPLILALNSLVAEYLYAENCHFTLSVFCTEAPFRNTLPDFEVTPPFRFSKPKVNEILEALISTEKTESLKIEIAQQYEESVSGSLLLAFIKALLQNLARDRTEQQKLLIATVGTNTDQPADLNTSESKSTAEESNTQLHYLHNYLLLLAKKVSKMTREFQRFQLERYGALPSPGPRARVKSTSRLHKYPTMYRNLERITENLKRKATQAQRKHHPPMRLIVDAVDTLANQFGKCAKSFESVTKAFNEKPAKPAENQTESEFHEKTYTDWVKEMNSTRNGQKFLNEVEGTLRKALDKQKEHLKSEVDMKLRHQKELLRIRYQQKVLDYVYKNNLPTKAEDEKLNKEHLRETTNVENVLQYEQLQRYEALKRKKASRESAGENQSLGIVLKYTPHKIPAENSVTVDVGQQTALSSPRAHAPVPAPEDPTRTRKRIKKLAKAFSEQDHVVDKIVYDAQLRIKELENEGNQVEQNFLNYLERQKLHKEVSRDLSNKLWSNYVAERVKHVYKVAEGKADEESSEESGDEDHADDTEVEAERLIKVATYTTPAQVEKQTSDMSISEGKLKFKNAILEAKEKFFEETKLFKETTEKSTAMPKQQTKTRKPESESIFNNRHFNFNKSDTAIMPEGKSKRLPTKKPANVIGNFKRQLYNSTKGRRSASPVPKTKNNESRQCPPISGPMTHRQWLSTLKTRKSSSGATATSPRSSVGSRSKVALAGVSHPTGPKSPTKTLVAEKETEEPTTSSSAVLRKSIAKIQLLFASVHEEHDDHKSENEVDCLDPGQTEAHTIASGGRSGSENNVFGETASATDIAANVNKGQNKNAVGETQKLQQQKSDINSSVAVKRMASKALMIKKSTESIDSNASQKKEPSRNPSTTTFVIHQTTDTELSLPLSSSITSIASNSNSTGSQYSLASVPENEVINGLTDLEGEEIGEFVDEHGRRCPIREVLSDRPESDASTTN